VIPTTSAKVFAMLTLADFLEYLIVSVAIVYVTYSLMRFTAYSVCWLIQKLPFEPATGPVMQAERAPSHPLPAGTGHQPPPYSTLPT
jgi:hypothetical protein